MFLGYALLSKFPLDGTTGHHGERITENCDDNCREPERDLGKEIGDQLAKFIRRSGSNLLHGAGSGHLGPGCGYCKDFVEQGHFWGSVNH